MRVEQRRKTSAAELRRQPIRRLGGFDGLWAEAQTHEQTGPAHQQVAAVSANARTFQFLRQ